MAAILNRAKKDAEQHNVTYGAFTWLEEASNYLRRSFCRVNQNKTWHYPRGKKQESRIPRECKMNVVRSMRVYYSLASSYASFRGLTRIKNIRGHRYQWLQHFKYKKPMISSLLSVLFLSHHPLSHRIKQSFKLSSLKTHSLSS